MYDAPRPAPPVLWIGLTFFFAGCCCLFFVAAGTEAVLLFTGAAVGGDSNATSGKPSFGDFKFYADSACSESFGRGASATVPTTTKTIYACIPYSNLKTGTAWGYNLTLNGNDVPGVNKTLKWQKEGKGTYALRLTFDAPLKPGDYELQLTLTGDDGPSATFKVGP